MNSHFQSTNHNEKKRRGLMATLRDTPFDAKESLKFFASFASPGDYFPRRPSNRFHRRSQVVHVIHHHVFDPCGPYSFQFEDNHIKESNTESSAINSPQGSPSSDSANPISIRRNHEYKFENGVKDTNFSRFRDSYGLPTSDSTEFPFQRTCPVSVKQHSNEAYIAGHPRNNLRVWEKDTSDYREDAIPIYEKDSSGTVWKTAPVYEKNTSDNVKKAVSTYGWDISSRQSFSVRTNDRPMCQKQSVASVNHAEKIVHFYGDRISTHENDVQMDDSTHEEESHFKEEQATDPFRYKFSALSRSAASETSKVSSAIVDNADNLSLTSTWTTSEKSRDVSKDFDENSTDHELEDEGGSGEDHDSIYPFSRSFFSPVTSEISRFISKRVNEVRQNGHTTVEGARRAQDKEDAFIISGKERGQGNTHGEEVDEEGDKSDEEDQELPFKLSAANKRMLKKMKDANPTWR